MPIELSEEFINNMNDIESELAKTFGFAKRKLRIENYNQQIKWICEKLKNQIMNFIMEQKKIKNKPQVFYNYLIKLIKFKKYYKVYHKLI